MDIQHLHVNQNTLVISTAEMGKQTFNVTPDQKKLLLEFDPITGERTTGWSFTYEYFMSVVNN
jgi:hypothetical protein